MSDWTNYGYLSEDARTNLILQSRDLGTTWNLLAGATVVLDQVGIDGVSNSASRLIDSGSGSLSYIYQDLAITADGSDYCCSVFIKKTVSSVTFPGIEVRVRTGGTDTRAGFTCNTNNGTMTVRTVGNQVPVSNGFIDYGDFWRFYAVVNDRNDLNTFVEFTIAPTIAASDTGLWSLTPTGDNTFDGAQLEKASFPSSFIPTTTTAETRAADNLVATIGTLDSPCTIAVEFRTGNGGTGTEVIIQADDDSAGIDHSIRISRTAGDIIALIETATATVATLNCGALANNTVGKVVVTCADGAFNATLFDADDAVVAQATPDTSGTAPTGMTKLRYGVDHTPANWLYGHVTTVRTWDTAETAYLSEWPEFDPAVIGSMGGNNTVVYGPSSTPAGTISLPQLKRIHAKVQSDLARVSARPDLHRALKSRKGRRR